MRRQQAISLARNRAWIGREMEVLVETMEARRRTNSRVKDETDNTHSPLHPFTPSPLLCAGRSFRDAPEIDGQVWVAGAQAKPGEFITARITEAREYDLVGVQVFRCSGVQDRQAQTPEHLSTCIPSSLEVHPWQ
jgi:ribosomal protein S12 methylthiotransferase